MNFFGSTLFFDFLLLKVLFKAVFPRLKCLHGHFLTRGSSV